MSLLPQRKKSAEEIAKLRENLGVPALQQTAEVAPAPAETTSGPSAEPAAQPVTHLPKRVRSLRKSEQVPILAIPPAQALAGSKLPSRRRSDEEIAAIRRREALAQLAPPPPNPKLAAAHPALLISGYLCALAGAACFFYPTFRMEVTASCVASALLIAAFIALTKPISSHHAGFIAVIALLVLTFGTLHYFPHLRHAS